MFSNSSVPPSRIRAQTPTRPSRITASSPTPSRASSRPSSRPSSSLSSTSSIIANPRPSTQTSSSSTNRRPASSMSLRTPLRQGPRFNQFTTPNRPASSMSNLRPSTPLNDHQAYCGTVKVSVRPRPLPQNAPGHSWELDPAQNTITTSDLGEFQYDHVYDPLASNHDVYRQTVKPIVDKCLDGFNGTIFAYGMTGSGKTYSMQGSEYEAGIIQLAVNEIYERIEFEQGRNSYSVSLSYLEIYNEKLYDLLNPDTSMALKSTSSQFASSASSSSGEIKIREDPVNGGVSIVGLHQEQVNSPDELLTHISKGDSIRRTGGTDFNSRSSRSHAIVMIKLKCHDFRTGTEKVSTLSLCDLAGSEKATTQQERRKEGAYINKSLLALSTVISKLSSQSLNNTGGSAPPMRTHIPYRDSKLTRLLQTSLSGSSVISILCTIHLSANAAPETINTLRFAARAKNIQLTVKKNEMGTSSADKDKIIMKLRSELDKIKRSRPDQVSSRKSSASGDDIPKEQTALSSAYESLKQDVNQLQAENKILMEQVEHYKRLNDYSRLNSTMVKNENLQALSELEVNKNYHNVHAIVVGLEDFYKKQVMEIEELSSYRSHLENKLKQAELNNGNVNVSASIVKEQQEEILDLKEQLSSKESIIRALKNSNRVRESLDSGMSSGISTSSRIPSLSTKRSDESMRSSTGIYSDLNLSSEMNNTSTSDDAFVHALKPIHDTKLNHIPLSSSPPSVSSKHIDIDEAW